MKNWTLQGARKHYLKNTPKCINCKFVDNEGTLRCLVKEEYCINLGYASECEYFTLKDGSDEGDEPDVPGAYQRSNERSSEDFDGGYVDFDGDIAP